MRTCSDFVGHLGEQAVALLAREVAVVDDAIEQDLDVHRGRGVHSCAVVDGVGVDTTAGQGVFDSTELGEAEVAPFAHGLAAQLAAVDTNGIVRLVTNRRIGLGRCLDVGADAAIPEQVHRRHQDGMHQFVRRQRDIARDAERLAYLR